MKKVQNKKTIPPVLTDIIATRAFITASPMEKPLSLLTFPCDFPIKILAENNFELEAFVKETLSVHIKNKKSIQIRSRKSSLENYVSITATFEAEDKSQLDKLYQVFSTHPKIKMVL